MIKTISQSFATDDLDETANADMEINAWKEVGWEIKDVHQQFCAYDKAGWGGSGIDPVGWTARSFILEWPHKKEIVYP